MNPIFTILQFTKSFWKWYLIMGLFVLTISGLSLVSPLLGKQVVDIIVAQLQNGSLQFSRLVTLLLLTVLADVLISVLTAVGQWIGDIFTSRLNTYLMKTFYSHALQLHISYFDQEVTGKIVNKMYRGISSITDFIQGMLNNFLPFFLTAIVTIVLLAQYSPFIAILLAALFPIYIGISHSSSFSWMKIENEKNQLQDKGQGRVFESIAGMRIVRSFATEMHELNQFLNIRKLIEALTVKQSRRWHLFDFFRRFTLNIILFAIYAYVVYWTFHARFTLGEMVLLLQLVQQARFPLFAMSYILGQIQQASSGSKDFFEVLHTPIQVKDKPGAKPIVISSSKKKNVPLISFKNVDFAYEGGKQVLTNITFNVQANEKFALVGESGQGKTTLINLLLRYYDATKGKIEIAGQDVASIQQQSLHEHIAVVFQESLLFSGSVVENIRYGKPDATIAEVEKVAKAANAHEFILTLPQGYETNVGERGVKLSGGQKQRIAIARAMLKDAPIILLDEATSALDSKAELEVKKGLDTLLKNRTSITIAHRLSTIANADHLVVLAGGTVAEYGAPEDLLKDPKSLYGQLVAFQQHMLKMPKSANAETPSELSKYDLIG